MYIFLGKTLAGVGEQQYLRLSRECYFINGILHKNLNFKGHTGEGWFLVHQQQKQIDQ